MHTVKRMVTPISFVLIYLRPPLVKPDVAIPPFLGTQMSIRREQQVSTLVDVTQDAMGEAKVGPIYHCISQPGHTRSTDP